MPGARLTPIIKKQEDTKQLLPCSSVKLQVLQRCTLQRRTRRRWSASWRPRRTDEQTGEGSEATPRTFIACSWGKAVRSIAHGGARQPTSPRRIKEPRFPARGNNRRCGSSTPLSDPPQ
ncbi:hypothetical protein AOLI_G00212340 [Acnodon oligacanthus]